MRCGQRTFRPDNKEDRHTCLLLYCSFRESLSRDPASLDLANIFTYHWISAPHRTRCFLILYLLTSDDYLAD